MTTDKAIENILKEQISAYRNLLEILTSERRYLVEIKVDKIEEVAREKDTVIMRLRLLEEERQRLIGKFISENRLAGNFDLHVLADITGNATFKDYRTELLDLLKVINEMSKFNEVLINKSLRHVRASSNFVQTFRQEVHSSNTGMLLSKET